jgi:hypothetical protein
VSGLFSARDTVMGETPASAATCLSVIVPSVVNFAVRMDSPQGARLHPQQSGQRQRAASIARSNAWRR